MESCRHYRYRLPRALADELRDADPEPCAVCDALPHRQQKTNNFGPGWAQLPVLNSSPISVRLNSFRTSQDSPVPVRNSLFGNADRHSVSHPLHAWFSRLTTALHLNHS